MMEKYIEAAQWLFGLTKRNAAKYINSCSNETRQEILRAFRGNAERAFNSD